MAFRSLVMKRRQSCRTSSPPLVGQMPFDPSRPGQLPERVGQERNGNMVASGIALSLQGAPALPKARSSLVRRLVAARNDPAKQRIRAWLAALEDGGLCGAWL